MNKNLEELGYKSCDMSIWTFGDFYLKLERKLDKPCYLCINKNHLSYYKFTKDHDPDGYEVEVPEPIMYEEHCAINAWIIEQKKGVCDEKTT